MRRALLLSLAAAAALLLWWFRAADPEAPANPAQAGANEPAVAATAAATAPAGKGADELAAASGGPASAPANTSAGERAATTGGAERSADPATAPRETFRARVVDGDGAPIEGAAVRVVDDPLETAVHTDADGVFDVLVPPGRHANLRIEAGARHVQASWPRRPDVRIRLPWAGPLRARIVDENTGAAIGGVEVTRHHAGCRACQPDRAVSDAKGYFVLAAVPRGEDCLFAFRAHDHPPQHERLRLDGTGEAIEHTFYLRRGAPIAGRCVDHATRAPIAGARVEFEDEAIATTAADGSFQALVLPPENERVELRFVAKGFCRTTYVVKTRQPDPAAEYALPRSATLTGRVLTPNGKAIGNAQVAGSFRGSSGATSGWPANARVADEHDEPQATSGADGAFRLTGLVPGGTYLLLAGHEHFVPQQAQSPGVNTGVSVEVRDGAPPVSIVLVPK